MRLKIQACVLALAVAVGGLATVSVPLPAQAANCDLPVQAAKRSMKRNKDEISKQAAATQIAVEAAKDCLALIDQAMNIVIPGIRFAIDWQGLLRSLLNRACQVVTSKLDEAGNLVENTFSDANNRFIGSVNDALGNDINGYIGARNAGSTSTGGPDFGGNPIPPGQTIPGAAPAGPGPGVGGGTGGMVDPGPGGATDTPAVPQAQAQSGSIFDNLACTLRGNCPTK